jgi:hypothetical protein
MKKRTIALEYFDRCSGHCRAFFAGTTIQAAKQLKALVAGLYAE